MASYTISLIPIEALTTQTNGANATPWSAGYHDSSGAQWNYVPWTISYDAADVVNIDIRDNDADPDHLNDDSWWNGAGRGSQTIQTNTGYAVAGDDITDEYELTFTGIVDGVQKTYTLAAIAVIKPPNGNLTPQSYIGYTFDGEWPPSGTVLTYVPNSNKDNATLDSRAQQTICFAAGTRIATDRGEVAVQDLREGDLVLTRDRGLQPVRWIGSVALGAERLRNSPHLRPVRIAAGALGAGVPQADLVVSPQHRILVRSAIALRMSGQVEVLLAAKQLLALEGVSIADDLATVEYFHILFDRHEVVFANGAEAESLFTGTEALRTLSVEARAEIFELFPELRLRANVPALVRPVLPARRARRLTARHIRNDRPMVAA